MPSPPACWTATWPAPASAPSRPTNLDRRTGRRTSGSRPTRPATTAPTAGSTTVPPRAARSYGRRSTMAPSASWRSASCRPPPRRRSANATVMPDDNWARDMPVAVQAGLWGLLAGGALVVGAAVAWWVKVPQKVVAGVMAFGAGVLISALAFDLVDEAESSGGLTATV